MINIKELYLLNLVLDKRDFFAVPDLKTVKMSPLLAENVCNSLIKKGILQNADTFTKKGAALVKCMSDYKSSVKYVKVGTLVIGIYEQNRGIALRYHPFMQQYFFTRVQLDFSEEKLIEEYPFLAKENRGNAMPEQKITYDELKADINFKYDSSVMLSSFELEKANDNFKKAVKNQLLFYYEGNHYCFDFESEMLSGSSAASSIARLQESMVLV